MKVLIAEDDMASRKFLFKIMSKYGTCDMVVDGMEALDAYLLSVRDNEPYDLICLDIMMPKVDGVRVLKAIRDYETQRGLLPEKRVRIIMTTALAETPYVRQSFEIGCEAYASKPIDTEKLVEVLKKLNLIA
jgi:two-component system, chemotaxis family, chemotaxis protein CheY